MTSGCPGGFHQDKPPPSYHINQPKLVVWYMDVSWQHKWFFHLSQAALKFDLLAAKYLANKNVMIGTQDIIYRYICIERGELYMAHESFYHLTISHNTIRVSYHWRESSFCVLLIRLFVELQSLQVVWEAL